MLVANQAAVAAMIATCSNRDDTIVLFLLVEKMKNRKKRVVLAIWVGLLSCVGYTSYIIHRMPNTYIMLYYLVY